MAHDESSKRYALDSASDDDDHAWHGGILCTLHRRLQAHPSGDADGGPRAITTDRVGTIR